ncbi:uncharacterized protein LOC129581022 [Paramacrobiotus metropolitanus]|uniref:uncharacterized protein LOC129581022 n=1 Tax=Paramacrobiotus metropolitanus TaxID=2943436 RepID=UPI00244592C8|nr:uncharacterized protein LOC129581022 [Paramacrobiotus metropolitanus]
MRAQRADLVISLAAVIIAAVHGEVTGDELAKREFLDPLDVCGELNDSVAAALETERLPLIADLISQAKCKHGEVVWNEGAVQRFLDPLNVCGPLNDSTPATMQMNDSACFQIFSSRVRQFIHEMMRLHQILEAEESLNHPPQKPRIIIGGRTTPVNRSPQWWMEPWYTSVIPELRLLYKAFPRPINSGLILGATCLIYALLGASGSFLDAMAECGVFEKIKLLLRILAVIALGALAFNVLMQFTYIALTLAEIHAEKNPKEPIEINLRFW